MSTEKRYDQHFGHGDWCQLRREPMPTWLGITLLVTVLGIVAGMIGTVFWIVR